MAALQEVLDESVRCGVPAIAVVGVIGDQVVCSGAAGLAGDDEPEASTENTVFPVASISKTFLAVVCLQCSERGELSLDADISQYLSEPVRNPAFPDQPITARHLLTHRSGLHDDESALLPGPFRTEGGDCSMPLAEYVQKHLRIGGEFFFPQIWSRARPPGEACYHYSNAGFTLLGHVVESATGRSLSLLAQERLFGPLRMTRTCFRLSQALALGSSNVAVPHGADRRPVGHYGVAEWPAAGAYSTADDLARYLLAFTGPSCSVLNRASLEELFPSDFTSGLAWWGRDAAYGDPRGCVWQHGGFMQGVRSHIYLWPTQRAGMVILTNGSRPYGDISQALRAALLSYQSSSPDSGTTLRYCADCGHGVYSWTAADDSAPRCAACAACYNDDV